LQLVLLTQAASPRKLKLLARFGLDMIDQPDPVHRRIKVEAVNEEPDRVADVPTAKQRVAPGHDTPLREFSSALDRFGLATSDHFDPSHRSVSVLVALNVPELPTAKQAADAEHDTA
jgi:hypothetical protein